MTWRALAKAVRVTRVGLPRPRGGPGESGFVRPKHRVLNQNNEMEDKYGNKRIDTWARVSVPVEEWFKYTEDVREDSYEVRKRVLAEWIVEGFPYSEELVGRLSE